jgi:hypothetical protein
MHVKCAKHTILGITEIGSEGTKAYRLESINKAGGIWEGLHVYLYYLTCAQYEQCLPLCIKRGTST